jgi:hypothetical protein
MTMKPAKVRMFMPNRMSMVSIALLDCLRVADRPLLSERDLVTSNHTIRGLSGRVCAKDSRLAIECVAMRCAAQNHTVSGDLDRCITVPAALGRAAIQVAFIIFVLTETWRVPMEGWFVDRFGPKIVLKASARYPGEPSGNIAAQRPTGSTPNC